MATYKWVKLNQTLKRLEDLVYIPVDPANTDYKQFLADGGVAAAEDAPLTADQQASTWVDAMDKLNFDVNFDQENRIRVLEGKAQITKAQYKNALIARWKLLNP